MRLNSQSKRFRAKCVSFLSLQCSLLAFMTAVDAQVCLNFVPDPCSSNRTEGSFVAGSESGNRWDQFFLPKTAAVLNYGTDIDCVGDSSRELRLRSQKCAPGEAAVDGSRVGSSGADVGQGLPDGGLKVRFVSPSPENNAMLSVGSNVKITVDAPSDTATVELFRNGVFVRTEGGRPYEWNILEDQDDPLLNNLAAGRYTFRADVISNEGIVISESLSVTVGSGLEKKDVSFSSPSPANNASLAAGSDITIKVEAPSNTATVELFRDDTLVRVEGGLPYEWNAVGQNDPLLMNLAEGKYTFRADAILHDGVVVSKAFSITVRSLACSARGGLN